MKTLFIFLFLIGVGVGSVFAQQTKTNYKITPPTSVKVKKTEKKASNKYQSKIEYLKNLEQYRKENNVPEDFPRFIDTGNPKNDLDNYYKAKQEWIKNNPEKFEKIKHLNL
jgi:nitrate/TMAO reductase-like tetraheme cytochrome c subunit